MSCPWEDGGGHGWKSKNNKCAYAVKEGRNPGVYKTWSEAKTQVDGYSGAKYKGFSSYSGAAEYMASGSSSYSNSGGKSSSRGYSSKSSHPYRRRY
eukprot:CAMPEP_0114555340 /NCGR_PEP_ID=MMETSP0114-20121206/8699_1 /TAXON_ID=31324 /ORGANISM="Goniomonas sp, Strain m" /LENGTH=95 /DNA_ID=CAMNT_0001740463 /DNA_START=3 /DNA_END=290 /DNA_ORIENTATION=-